MKTALILVDLQNDFCPGGALAVPNGDEVLPIAKKLLRAAPFDLVILTQDWHPPDHKSFASQHEGKKPYDVIDLNGLPQVLWPDHCVQKSSGASFCAEFLPLLKGPFKVFQKGTNPEVDSYSGFKDNGWRGDTGLDGFLKGEGITSVFVMGLATDYCVKFTALDARRLGYNVTLLVDGCRGVNLHPEDSGNAIAEMRSAGVAIAKSDDFLRKEPILDLHTEVPLSALKRREGTPVTDYLREKLKDPDFAKEFAATGNAMATMAQVASKNQEPDTSDLITPDELGKIDLRVGTVTSAEVVPKAKKLLKLQVNFGEPAPRQILAGLALSFKPEDLVGKQFVFVTNLPPREMMGLISNGMVLATGESDKLSLVSPSLPTTPGARLR